jgi:hypothetical protein
MLQVDEPFVTFSIKMADCDGIISADTSGKFAMIELSKNTASKFPPL